MWKAITDKVLSGRFIFTIVSAFVFAILAINKTLPVDKVYEIVLVVVYAYFSRNDRNGTPPKPKDPNTP